MLIAEELAYIAVDPDSGRHALGTRDRLNACLAGLLVAELVVDGLVEQGDRAATVVPVASTPPPSELLAAAAEVVAERGPKIKAVLSHMSRGLEQRLGLGTWDAVVAGLMDAGLLGPAEGTLRRHPVLDPTAQEAIVQRLRAAADGDGPVELRTALVLSMTGPANLLELVAPTRAGRKHARHRIDHALDHSQLEPVGEVVRKVLAEAAAAAAAVAATTTVAATSG